jgi:hypothetical protein
MKRSHLILSLALVTATSIGCKHDKEGVKVVDGLPVSANQTVIPANAVQHLMLLRKQSLRTIVQVLNKTTQSAPTYPELSGGPTYNFTITDERLGTATYSITFRDGTNATIDPVGTQSSSSTVKSIVVTASGVSTLFPTYSESSTLTLDVQGDVNSPLRSLGDWDFQTAGATYDIDFTMNTPGRVNVEGMRDGAIFGTGTGPGGAISMTLSVSNDHSADGPISWEGQEGGLHISPDGDGFLTTRDSRILIN